MIINYEVKNLFFLLLKRWYIVVAAALLCAVVVIPLSSASFNAAVENYKQKMDFDSILEEETRKKQTEDAEKEKEILEELDEQKGVQDLIYATAYYGFELSSDSEFLFENVKKEEERTRDAYINTMDNAVKVSNSDIFAIQLYESIKDQLLLSYNQFRGIYSVSIVPGMNIIELSLKDVPEIELDSFVKQFPKQMVRYLEDSTGTKVEMTLNNIIKTEEPKESSVTLNEALNLQKIAAKKLQFNREILREPTMKGNQIKYMVSAGLFGAVVACFGVLMADFFIRSAKREKNCSL